MKGLLFTDKFAPHTGGTAIIYYNWAKYIDAGRLSVVTCTVPGKDHRATDRELLARVYRVPFINIPKLRMPLCWLLIFLLSPIAIFKQRPQVLHAGQPLETGWIAWFWARILRKPYVLHCFGDDIPLYWNARFVGRIMRFLARRADHITVISRFSGDKLKALGIPAERISLIYPGVTPASAEPGSVGAEPVDHKTGKVLLTVGRLITRKGHDRVIEALPSILSRMPDVEYVIVGSGSEQERLSSLAKSIGVEGSVTFVGAVPHESVGSYYRKADVFVHPNRRLTNGEVEGFGMVFIEASAYGVPVIGGNTGGTPDAIIDGQTGYLVDPESVEEISDCVLKLLCDEPLRREMGDAGRVWAARFTWEIAAQELDRISELASRST